MTKKSSLLLLFIIMACCHANAQQDYILTDTSMRAGLKLQEGSKKENAAFIRLKHNEATSIYTPDQISAYGFKDGRFFQSFAIDVNGQSKRHFFERLFDGEYDLYFLGSEDATHRFFLTAHDTLPLQAIPNEREAYISFLNGLLQNCPEANKHIRHVELTENSLVRFLRNYEACSGVSLARFRYGVNFGVSLERLAPQSTDGLLDLPRFKKHGGIFLGFFTDLPIAKSNFSFLTGTTVHNYKTSAPFSDRSIDYDLVVNQWRLDIPLSVKYSIYKLNRNTFFGAGPIYSLALKGSTDLYKYRSVNNDIFIDIDNTPMIPRHQVGFCVMGGMTVRYDAGHSYLFQGGYQRLYSLKRMDESLLVHQILVTLGLLF